MTRAKPIAYWKEILWSDLELSKMTLRREVIFKEMPCLRL